MPAITKSPPWETFYHEVEALFEGDPDIDVMRQYSETRKRINIFVRNDKKYAVLLKYVPVEKVFGAVKVQIMLIPANDSTANSVKEDMKTLFANNKNVSKVETKDILGGSLTYVAFNNGVVQFFDDNTADLNRNKTILMEDIARDVLMPVDGVYFCTDKKAEEKKIVYKTTGMTREDVLKFFER